MGSSLQTTDKTFSASLLGSRSNGQGDAHEGNEGHEGDEGDAPYEGHEGRGRCGSDEDAQDESDEGHESYEGNEEDEGHEEEVSGFGLGSESVEHRCRASRAAGGATARV